MNGRKEEGVEVVLAVEIEKKAPNLLEPAGKHKVAVDIVPAFALVIVCPLENKHVFLDRLFEDFFHQRLPVEHANKLSKEDQHYMQHIMDVGNKVTLLIQDSQEGFGHAVHCAREWVGNEPFMLMLGDHLFASDTDMSCIEQLVDLYERTGRSVVGLQETPEAELKNFGCVTGIWEEGGSLLSITEFAEKPPVVGRLTLGFQRSSQSVEGVGVVGRTLNRGLVLDTGFLKAASLHEDRGTFLVFAR